MYYYIGSNFWRTYIFMTNVVTFKPQTQIAARSATIVIFGYSQKYMRNQFRIMQEILGMTIEEQELENEYDTDIVLTITFSRPVNLDWLREKLDNICDIQEHLGYRIDDSDEDEFYTENILDTTGLYFPYL